MKDRSTSNKKPTKIYFQQGENYNIPKHSKVTVVDYGNKMIIKNSWRKPKNLSRFKRKDKDHYEDTLTGKIKEYKRVNKFKTFKEVKKAMNKLKELILNNFQGKENELFITLTCKDNITDIKRIKYYAQYFMRRLRKTYPESKFEYIYKFERMENERWHVHLLLKDINNKELFIPNEKIERLWKRGITKTQRIYEEDGEDEINNENDSLSKINVKGKFGIANYMSKRNQLRDFPIGERIYIKSRGIKLPKEIHVKYGEIIKEMGSDYSFVNENITLVRSKVTDNILNIHKTEVYKKNKD